MKYASANSTTFWVPPQRSEYTIASTRMPVSLKQKSSASTHSVIPVLTVVVGAVLFVSASVRIANRVVTAEFTFVQSGTRIIPGSCTVPLLLIASMQRSLAKLKPYIDSVRSPSSAS